VKWLFGGLLLVIGALAVRLLWVAWGIPYSNQVDIGNCLNAAATAFVALLVGYLYAERASSRRANTDLLLECAREVKAAITALHQAALPCHRGKKLSPLERITLTTAERELSNAVHSFEHATACCKMRSNPFQLDKLKDARATLKDTLTDTPFPGPYDNSACSRINSAFKSVRDELTRITFDVNRR